MELQSKTRETLDEVSQLRKTLEETNRARQEIQSFADELSPKYDLLMTER